MESNRLNLFSPSSSAWKAHENFRNQREEGLPFVGKPEKRVKPKKAHEVERIRQFFDDHFSAEDVVVFDIGSGKGYIDDCLAAVGYEVVALECDDSKRPLERNLLSSGAVWHENFRLSADDACVEEFDRLVRSHLGNRSKRACLLSLHGCGDLSPAILKAYRKISPEYRGGLLVVSCCYHLVSNADGFVPLAISRGKGAFDGDLRTTEGPAVEVTQCPRLSTASLRLAAQDSPSLWRRNCWDGIEHETHAKRLVYRSLLESFAQRDDVTIVKSSAAGVKQVELDCGNFATYFATFASKHRILDRKTGEREDFPGGWLGDGSSYLEENPAVLRVAEGFKALQYRLQPVLESFVLYDMFCFLEEGGGLNEMEVAKVARPEKPIRKRFVNRVPESISENPELKAACECLPKNYNFEIPKTLWRIKESGARRVGLQMPEGLLLFATTIADIIATFADGVEDVVIMGDVTYGACCVDDFTARRVGVDFLVHYGHSCLVPIDVTSRGGVTVMYVFVDVAFDVSHLVDCVKANFGPETGACLALASTVQFLSALHLVASELTGLGVRTKFLHARPLSKGEVLGCTAARADSDVTALLYVGDGRFHLEAAMIANPELPAYKYDPYSKKFTREHYDHEAMMAARKQAVDAVDLKEGSTIGLILGTLGRQGNPRVLHLLEEKAAVRGCKTVIYLMSEIFPAKLALCSDVDVWVQVACPRLSIDWGGAFSKPILTPYEAAVALDLQEWQKDVYPMDFYAAGSLGQWTPGHKCGKEKTCSCAS